MEDSVLVSIRETEADAKLLIEQAKQKNAELLEAHKKDAQVRIEKTAQQFEKKTAKQRSKLDEQIHSERILLVRQAKEEATALEERAKKNMAKAASLLVRSIEENI